MSHNDDDDDDDDDEDDNNNNSNMENSKNATGSRRIRCRRRSSSSSSSGSSMNPSQMVINFEQPIVTTTTHAATTSAAGASDLMERNGRNENQEVVLEGGTDVGLEVGEREDGNKKIANATNIRSESGGRVESTMTTQRDSSVFDNDEDSSPKEEPAGTTAFDCSSGHDNISSAAKTTSLLYEGHDNENDNDKNEGADPSSMSLQQQPSCLAAVASLERNVQTSTFDDEDGNHEERIISRIHDKKKKNTSSTMELPLLFGQSIRAWDNQRQNKDTSRQQEEDEEGERSTSSDKGKKEKATLKSDNVFTIRHEGGRPPPFNLSTQNNPGSKLVLHYTKYSNRTNCHDAELIYGSCMKSQDPPMAVANIMDDTQCRHEEKWEEKNENEFQTSREGDSWGDSDIGSIECDYNKSQQQQQQQHVYTGNATFQNASSSAAAVGRSGADSSSPATSNKVGMKMIDCIAIYDPKRKCYVLELVDVAVTNLRRASSITARKVVDCHEGAGNGDVLPVAVEKGRTMLNPQSRAIQAERQVKRLKKNKQLSKKKAKEKTALEKTPSSRQPRGLGKTDERTKEDNVVVFSNGMEGLTANTVETNGGRAETEAGVTTKPKSDVVAPAGGTPKKRKRRTKKEMLKGSADLTTKPKSDVVAPAGGTPKKRKRRTKKEMLKGRADTKTRRDDSDKVEMKTKKPFRPKSGYWGVTEAPKKNSKSGYCYRAQVMVDGKLKYLGTFDTALEAARKYDEIASEQGKEGVHLNFPNDSR